MSASDFLSIFPREWAVIWNAPWLFGLAVLICGVIIWRAAKWQYGAIIAHRDAEIASLKSQLSATQASGVAAQTAEAPDFAAVFEEALGQDTPERLEPPRVTGDANQVAELMRPGASIAEQKEAATFQGTILSVKGTINRLSVNSGSIIAVMNKPEGYHGPPVQVFFPANNPRASLLVAGEAIEAVGQATVINQVAIGLTDSTLA